MTDIDQERADLNALVREAHEAIQDLRTVLRGVDQRIVDAKAVQENLMVEVASMVQADFSDLVGAAATQQVDALAASTADAIAKAEERVMNRFQEIADILLGASHATSLADEARKVRAFMDERGHQAG